MRDSRLRLADILEAIGKITGEFPIDRTEFDRDDKLKVWCAYYLQVIGEAARGLDQAATKAMPEIAWGQWIGFRNILVHQYFQLDQDVLWKVIHEELPGLESSIQKYMKLL